MKRGFIIISLFLLLLACCTVEEIFLKQNLVKLQDKAISLKENIENAEDINSIEIQTQIKDLDKFWSETETYFCIIVNHINMEEAGEQISKIKTLSKQNKKEETLVEVDLLIYFSESYEHLIVPNIQNIL